MKTGIGSMNKLIINRSEIRMVRQKESIFGYHRYPGFSWVAYFYTSPAGNKYHGIPRIITSVHKGPCVRDQIKGHMVDFIDEIQQMGDEFKGKTIILK